jgi:cytoskeleton protein RodZ
MSESIGNALKEARNKKAVSLEEVHSKIKIHPRVLQLLEENKFEKLPSPLFVKSFIKSYADFLELNGDDLVSTYEKEGKPAPEQVLFIKPPELRTRRPENEKRWFVLAATIGIIGGGIFAALFLFHFASEKMSGTSSVSTDPSKPATLKTKKTPTASKSEKAKKTASKPESSASKKPNEWLRSVEMGNFPTINQKTPLDLNIKAIDNVWMRITCDGKVLFQSILKRGQAEKWSADQSIEIWTGNSSNMVLSLNGHLLGSPGKGVVKKMIINHEGVKIPS